jgi:FkbM family methyltransferase
MNSSGENSIQKRAFYAVSHLLANRLAQDLLKKALRYGEYLHGIGSGAHTEISGERKLIELVLRTSGEAPVIFDVGANIGEFSQLVVDEAGRKFAEIHSFEPTQKTFAVLVANVGKASCFHPNRLALGETEGEVTIYYDDFGSGLASRTKRDLAHCNVSMNMEEKVAITTIDLYCQNAGVSVIDLLKIDVEGHEIGVLKGASAMMASGGIRNIMWEFGGANLDTVTRFKDFWKILKANGFKNVYRLIPPGYLYKIETYEESLEKYTTTNYVASLNGL